MQRKKLQEEFEASVKDNKAIEAKVVDFNEADHKISLSIKALTSGSDDAEEASGAVEETAEAAAETEASAEE